MKLRGSVLFCSVLFCSVLFINVSPASAQDSSDDAAAATRSVFDDYNNEGYSPTPWFSYSLQTSSGQEDEATRTNTPAFLFQHLAAPQQNEDGTQTQQAIVIECDSELALVNSKLFSRETLAEFTERTTGLGTNINNDDDDDKERRTLAKRTYDEQAAEDQMFHQYRHENADESQQQVSRISCSARRDGTNSDGTNNNEPLNVKFYETLTWLAHNYDDPDKQNPTPIMRNSSVQLSDGTREEVINEIIPSNQLENRIKDPREARTTELNQPLSREDVDENTSVLSGFVKTLATDWINTDEAGNRERAKEQRNYSAYTPSTGTHLVSISRYTTSFFYSTQGDGLDGRSEGQLETRTRNNGPVYTFNYQFDPNLATTENLATGGNSATIECRVYGTATQRSYDDVRVKAAIARPTYRPVPGAPIPVRLQVRCLRTE